MKSSLVLSLPQEILERVVVFTRTEQCLLNFIRAFQSEPQFSNLLPFLRLKDLVLKNEDLKFGPSKSIWPVLTLGALMIGDEEYDLIKKLSHFYSKIRVTENSNLSVIKRCIKSSRTKVFLDLVDKDISNFEFENILADLKHCNFMIRLELDEMNIGRDRAILLAKELLHARVSEIDLRSNPMGDPGIEAILALIKGHSDINKLALDDTNITARGAGLLSSVLKGSQLTHLDLSSNALGNEGIRALSKVLVDTRITNLKIYGCEIDVDGAKYVIDVLPKTSLKSLDLSCHELGNSICRDLGIAVSKSNLLKLRIEDIDINGYGLELLASGVKDSKLCHLNLGQNNVGGAGFNSGITTLLRDTCLNTLVLDECGIGKSGTVSLCAVLPHSRLARLNLGRNCIGNDGAKELSKVLASCRHLQTLNLNYNMIERDGGVALAQALPNSTLKLLDLSHNRLGNEGGLALALAALSSSIDLLYLLYCRIQEDVACILKRWTIIKVSKSP